jgi:glycosyltransferase involved in cell wall biosynthesis
MAPSQNSDQQTNIYMISVVIPTRGRPQLLQRAIRSVLVQTHQDFEVIVVLDGVDAQSTAAVEELKEPRIRLVTLPQRAGGAVARNAGVAAARGRWIAFLDDDDEFTAEKLALQLQSAMGSNSPEQTLTVCKARVIERRIARVWPTRFPAPGERIVEYLFCRKSLRQGEAFLQSSTYFVSRALALRIPFRQHLERHQDWDWVVQLQQKGVEIVAVPRVLTVYHRDDNSSLSRQSGWEQSLDWAKGVVAPESSRAYSFFIATQCVTRLDARQCWSWSVLRRLSGECFGNGKANRCSTVLFAYFWMRALYKSLGARAGRRKGSELNRAQGIDTKPKDVSASEN